MFKVAVEEVRVFPHPNADALDLVAIGDSQYVVEKALYKSKDKAVAVPKGALLTHPILLKEWEKYLKGKDKNIVGFVVLRGQESQGIVIREDILSQMGFNINDYEVGVDISKELGITKYIPPIPENLVDTVEVYSGPTLKRSVQHDCKYASVYIDKFVEDEEITISSKLHGTQINIIWAHDNPDETSSLVYSSKGLWDQGLVFKKGTDNIYTKAWYNFITDATTSVSFWQTLSEIIKDDIFKHQVQIVGEVVPAIKGFNYGHKEPTLYVFSIYIDGQSIDLALLRRMPNINIVPELYRGPFKGAATLALAGLYAEQPFCPIDGTTLNEGVVLSNGKHFIKQKNTKFMNKHGKDETT